MPDPKSNMYADAKTWNPFKGCRFDCTYCVPSFQLQSKRQKQLCDKCCKNVPYCHDDRLAKIPSASIIFACGNADISFCPPRCISSMDRRFETRMCVAWAEQQTRVSRVARAVAPEASQASQGARRCWHRGSWKDVAWNEARNSALMCGQAVDAVGRAGDGRSRLPDAPSHIRLRGVTLMAQKRQGGARRPATKFAHLRKKMEKNKVLAKVARKKK